MNRPGFQIDPIEKKSLYHFYPGISVLSLNPGDSPKELAEAAARLGCPSVAFRCNHPAALDAARACRQRGVRTVAVTADCILPQAGEELFSVVDAISFVAHPARLLDTIKWVHEQTPVWMELTNLMVPDQQDSFEEVDQLCRWMLGNLGPDVPLHVAGPRPVEMLLRARERAFEWGLHYVYVDSSWGQATSCPGCGDLLIDRDGYRIKTYRLEGSRCADCGTEIAGRFSAFSAQTSTQEWVSVP